MEDKRRDCYWLMFLFFILSKLHSVFWHFLFIDKILQRLVSLLLQIGAFLKFQFMNWVKGCVVRFIKWDYLLDAETLALSYLSHVKAWHHLTESAEGAGPEGCIRQQTITPFQYITATQSTSQPISAEVFMWKEGERCYIPAIYDFQKNK